MITEINEKVFEDKILNNNGKVFVDCYANWCGPCKMVAPIIEDLAKENTNYQFYKMDVDENENIASQYNIMSIPTFLIFENGKLIKQETGVKTKEEFNQLLKD